MNIYFFRSRTFVLISVSRGVSRPTPLNRFPTRIGARSLSSLVRFLKLKFVAIVLLSRLVPFRPIEVSFCCRLDWVEVFRELRLRIWHLSGSRGPHGYPHSGKEICRRSSALLRTWQPFPAPHDVFLLLSSFFFSLREFHYPVSISS